MIRSRTHRSIVRGDTPNSWANSSLRTYSERRLDFWSSDAVARPSFVPAISRSPSACASRPARAFVRNMERGEGIKITHHLSGAVFPITSDASISAPFNEQARDIYALARDDFAGFLGENFHCAVRRPGFFQSGGVISDQARLKARSERPSPHIARAARKCSGLGRQFSARTCSSR